MIWLYTILLAASLYFLGSRTMVTRWLWSRYPPKFYEFMSCAMCAPFWYTLGIVIVALSLGYQYPGLLDDRHALIVMPLCAIVTTPLVVHVVEWLLMATEPTEEQPPTEPKP